MTVRIILVLVALLSSVSQLHSKDMILPKSAEAIGDASEKSTQNTLPGDQSTQKIIKRHNLENEGWVLAKKGLYEQALIKYKVAQNPALLNYDYEKPELPIIQLYIRQGKFEEALQLVGENLKKRTTNEEIDREERELLALIEARDTKSSKPIYEYINYIKSKYVRFFPPSGKFVGMGGFYINDLIYLYNYMHDYDSGIAFMDEIIKYHANHPDKNHRSAHTKDVREYTRVKQAWELDKKTGQHGHLQDVIRTSDVISW